MACPAGDEGGRHCARWPRALGGGGRSLAREPGLLFAELGAQRRRSQKPEPRAGGREDSTRGDSSLPGGPAACPKVEGGQLFTVKGPPGVVRPPTPGTCGGNPGGPCREAAPGSPTETPGVHWALLPLAQATARAAWPRLHLSSWNKRKLAPQTFGNQQSAMGAPRTVRGGRVSASGGVGVCTSRPRRLCHGPGLARAEDRSAGTARHPRAAAGGQEIAPQTWEGAPVCVSPSRTGGQGGTCTQEPPVELGRHAPLLSPPHQTKVWSEPGADVRGGSGPALSTGRGRPTPEASPRVPAPMHKSETGTRNTYDNTIQIFTHNSQKHKHRGSTGEAPAGPWGGLWWHRLTSARPAQDTFGR